MIHSKRTWFTLLVLTTLLVVLPAVAGAALKNTSYGGGNAFLELDGKLMGALESFEGGMPYAEVAFNQVAGVPDQVKRVAGVKYSDITMTFGSGMAPPLYQWLQEALAKKVSAKSGAIVFVDLNYNEIKRLSFNNALIKEIAFSPLDPANGKSLFHFTLKLIPEVTRPEPGKGGRVTQGISKQKALMVNNFRLNMPGIDGQWVTKIELPSLKVKIVTERIGAQRMPTTNVAAVEFSDVAIEMPDNRAQVLGEWVNDFLVMGNNGPGKEKSAMIEILDQSLKTTLMTINLNNLGVLKLEASKFESHKDAIRTLRATMYCGGIQFNFTGK